MKILLATVALSILPIAASAQDVPKFAEAISPEGEAKLAWQDYMAVMKPDGALDTKTKELIGLAVAAQIPCQYCIYAHTLGAKHAGATDAQIKEAVGASALVRKMSTELNGNQYDLDAFKKEISAAYGVPSQ
jgi:AhpD family alkylhydroperoxidase